MTQYEAIESLDNYEVWIALRWIKLSPRMKEAVAHVRHEMIAQLQIIQLREFDRS